MKYAFMSFSTPDQSLEKMLETARRYGYDGIEPRLDSDHQHGIETDTDTQARVSIRAQCAAAGIEIACIATSCCFADPEDKDSRSDLAHECIDLAGDLGCQRLRVFGGLIGVGSQRSQAIDRVSDALRSLSQHAAERSVVLCMETHDDWTDPQLVATVIQKVDHPNIAVNWDAVHPVRLSGSTFEKSYALLKPWIRHVHVHDALKKEPFQFMALGQGDFDHREVLRLLQADGYDGYLSGEWMEWEPPDVHLPRELATLKSYAGAVDS